MSILYVVYAILAIGILIFVHELGHFTVARALHMYVNEFSLGFGWKLFQRKRNGVLYSIRAIPYGGYVRFDNPEAENPVEEYYKAPVWKRFLVSIAGSATNVIFAFVLAFILLWASGYQTIVNRIDTVNPGSPAEVAGVAKGDVVVAVNGQQVAEEEGTERVNQVIQDSKGMPVTFTIRRGEEFVQLQVTPSWIQEQNRYMVGVTFGLSDKKYLTPWQAFTQAGQTVVLYTTEIFRFFIGLFTRGQGAGDVTGVVGAVSTMADYGAQYGFLVFISTVIGISMNLAIMNLLPLPALDGSKVVFLVIEAIRRKPVPPEKEGVVNAIGFAVFGALFILLTFRDVFHLISGG